MEEHLRLAQALVAGFARRHGWERHVTENFYYRAEIYDDKNVFDRRLLEILGEPPETKLLPTHSAALEKEILISVSPRLYGQNFPQGIEDGFFTKLLAHEIIHRLHVRILDGDEDGMGPIWFFEGFAIYGSGQFTRSAPALSDDDVRKIIRSTERGSYLSYAAVIHRLAAGMPLQEMVRRAALPGFVEWIEERLFA
jgi:hypothetical protein